MPFHSATCNQWETNSFVTTLDASRSFLLCNKSATRALSSVKHTRLRKVNASAQVSCLQPSAVAMEPENSAESMRKWREKKEEKKKAAKKNYYEKNKVKISQLHVEKKSKMAEGKRTRASLNRGCRGGAVTASAKASSAERVRKLRQKKAAEKEEEERRKQLSKERSKRYRDKKQAGVLTGQSVMPTVSPESSSSPSAFQSRMAKKRAVDKTKNVLPKTPEKKVEIVENLVCSP